MGNAYRILLEQLALHHWTPCAKKEKCRGHVTKHQAPVGLQYREADAKHRQDLNLAAPGFVSFFISATTQRPSSHRSIGGSQVFARTVMSVPALLEDLYQPRVESEGCLQYSVLHVGPPLLSNEDYPKLALQGHPPKRIDCRGCARGWWHERRARTISPAPVRVLKQDWMPLRLVNFLAFTRIRWLS